MVTRIVCFLVLLFSCSCVKTLPDEELTINKTPYYGNDIRLDGCFVSETYDNESHCSYIFFYRNGVLLRFGDIKNINNIYQISAGIETVKNYKGHWGLYSYNDNLIILQRWNCSDVYSQFIIFNQQFNVVDDSTLVDKSNQTIYHFKYFNPKPDSTNVFIK